MNSPKEAFRRKEAGEESRSTGTYMILFKALLICFSITIVMVVLYALALSLTALSDDSMPIVLQSIIMISIVCGGIYSGKRVYGKGWFYGLMLGLIFALLLVPIGMAFGREFIFDAIFVAKLCMSCIVGLIGGIIGINLK